MYAHAHKHIRTRTGWFDFDSNYSHNMALNDTLAMLDAWSRHHSIHVRIRMPTGTNIHTQTVCVFTRTYAIFVRTYSHILTNIVFGQYYQTRYCFLATALPPVEVPDRVDPGGGLFTTVSTTCVSGSSGPFPWPSVYACVSHPAICAAQSFEVISFCFLLAAS